MEPIPAVGVVPAVQPANDEICRPAGPIRGMFELSACFAGDDYNLRCN